LDTVHDRCPIFGLLSFGGAPPLTAWVEKTGWPEPSDLTLRCNISNDSPKNAFRNRAVRARVPSQEDQMPESVYKVVELIGTSTESWEKAAAAAITRASKSLRDLRIAEVTELDLQVENGKIKAYRAKLKVSFKYQAAK
jgi:flavin-binding protein dodecin